MNSANSKIICAVCGRKKGKLNGTNGPGTWKNVRIKK